MENTCDSGHFFFDPPHLGGAGSGYPLDSLATPRCQSTRISAARLSLQANMRVVLAGEAMGVWVVPVERTRTLQIFEWKGPGDGEWRTSVD